MLMCARGVPAVRSKWQLPPTLSVPSCAASVRVERLGLRQGQLTIILQAAGGAAGAPQAARLLQMAAAHAAICAPR